jgi:2-polyprenyl-3-methyl-5-hydroxy-6-metoxy-1,4-benzoquinol methylase
MADAENTAIRPSYHALTRLDVLQVVPRAGGALLDVGGGVGATAAHLKNEGYVERAGVVDLVTHDAAANGLDFHHKANLEDPDALAAVFEKEGPFKVILCLDVLEHLSDPWSLVKSLHSMLAKDGVIVASIPNIRFYKASFPLFFRGRWDLESSGILDRTHLRWFVRDTAVQLMTSSGLKLEAVVDKPGGGRKIRLIRTATFGLLNEFTNLQYLIRVRNAN